MGDVPTLTPCIAAGALLATGCCVVPCVRALGQRLMEAALWQQTPTESLRGDEMVALEEMKEVENRETSMKAKLKK